MAGTSSPTPVPIAAIGVATRSAHAFAADRWRSATPFAPLSQEARAARLREAGMYGREPDCRIGSDAFDLRDDVAAGDACETVEQLLRSLIGSLEVLAAAPDASVLHKDAVSACAFLARQAAGALAVVAAGVFPGQSAQFEPYDGWPR